MNEIQNKKNIKDMSEKKNEEFSLFIVTYYIFCFLGLSVFVKYIYSSIVSPQDIGYWISQYSFMSIQTLLDTATIVLIYVSFKNKLSLKVILGSFFLMFYLNDIRYIVKIHHFISQFDLYWGIFKTGADGTVTTLQYARITIITIAFISGIISTFFLKRSLLKFFVFIMTIAVYIAVIFLHYYVAFKPSKDAVVTIGEQMKMVEFSSNPMELCKYTEYNCHIVKRGEVYNKGVLRKQNLATSVNAGDMQISINELNKVINSGINQIFENKKETKFFHEGTFNANLFRAVVFNIKKIDDNTVIVIQDNKTMSGVTETYLFLLNLYSYIFLFFWAYSLKYLYIVHMKINMKNNIEKLIQ